MLKPIVGLIDTGTSNIKSVFYALKECGANVEHITNYELSNKNLDALVIPGIGSFKFVMEKLRKEKLDKLILESIDAKKPALFICVGMQILFSESYEFGVNTGLDVFNGKVVKLDENISNSESKRKIPFIGWNKIIKKNNCSILKNISTDDFFYFTHSYCAKPSDKTIISSEVDYFDFKYCSSISYGNIFATQFHPEKSSKKGIQLYKNFLEII